MRKQDVSLNNRDVLVSVRLRKRSISLFKKAEARQIDCSHYQNEINSLLIAQQ